MTTVPRWRKSSRSGQESNCVEVANTAAVRDSKNPAGPVLAFTEYTLSVFLGGVKAGRFDES